MKILILAQDPVGKFMSSQGIRAYYMAHVLGSALPDASVVLAVPNEDNLPDIDGVSVRHYERSSSGDLVAQHDIVISSRFSPRHIIQFPQKIFIADLFSQYYMEWMELSKAAQGFRRSVWMNKVRAHVAMQLTFGDFILCANERQRDSYIGMLSALGLISPEVYDRDPSLRCYIDVAPHGVRPDELVHKNRVMKGVVPGIRETDTVIMWNGGTVAWYDPETLLRALHRLSEERDDIKAIFLGASYPGLAILGRGERFTSALVLAKELGLYDRSAFFEFGWAPHEVVADYLLESDIGVCAYFDNLETYYSHRTRFLDLFWAELPVICTKGDVLAAMVDQLSLGITIEEGDVIGMADAIRRLADDQELRSRCQENLRALKASLSWDEAFAPLVRFCRNQELCATSKVGRLLPLAARNARYILTLATDALVRRF